MTIKANINKDEDLYLHTISSFENDKRDNEEVMDNTPLLYMHGGEWNICPHTYSQS
jgi:hypothetical protein